MAVTAASDHEYPVARMTHYSRSDGEAPPPNSVIDRCVSLIRPSSGWLPGLRERHRTNHSTLFGR